jgi:hypothetical protein
MVLYKACMQKYGIKSDQSNLNITSDNDTSMVEVIAYQTNGVAATDESFRMTTSAIIELDQQRQSMIEALKHMESENRQLAQ